MLKTNRISLITGAVVLVLVLILAFTLPGAAQAYDSDCNLYGTFWSLVPPILAIVLALVTKEVYSSLLLGILVGAVLYSNFSFEGTLNAIFFSDGGIVTNLADSWNMGIMVFLVMLGTLVCLMNKAGGSAAFGRWASKHIHTRVGAQVATVILGVLIFVDDYFNCLTVGSVMRPITDRHNVSRAKLSYLIDATAAPVCIIAPISSWAAAVTSYVPEEAGINGFLMFIKTIPYNLYAILTIVMMLFLAITRTDFGPMARFERNAMAGDLFTTDDRPYGDDVGQDEAGGKANASLWDLVAPVVVLIAACIVCLAYTGGWFEGESFVDAFANADASMGLVLGGFIGLVFTFVYYMIRRAVTFREFFEAFVDGFKAMVPAMLILTFAWSLSGMTKYCLGSTDYVQGILDGTTALAGFLPVILFLLACAHSYSGVLTQTGITTMATNFVIGLNLSKNGFLIIYTILMIFIGMFLNASSITLILYAGLTQTSVNSLFAAGIVPGILLGVGFMAWSSYVSYRNGYAKVDPVPWLERYEAFKKAFLALLTPVIVIGGMFAGLFTATEAAAVASFYVMILGFVVYRTLHLKDLPKIFWETVEQTAKVMFVIATAGFFQYVLLYTRIPQQAIAFISETFTSIVPVLLIIILILVLMGCFMEGTAILLITVPIFVPLAKHFNYDVVQMGIVMCISLAVGVLTPPVGLNLYVMASITGEKIMAIAKYASGYVLIMAPPTIMRSYIE